jgi:glycosyltransferase involved in cell wall biosynthesis
MRVVVEALAADFGGIRTYLDNLLPAWREAFPDDRLLVVVHRDSHLDTSTHERLELDVRRPAILGRPWAQTRQGRRIARAFAADAVLATLPATGLTHPGVPLVVVVHDLRHELRPDQFSRARRALRAVSYNRAYALADGFVAVSQRTLDDLHRLHPATHRVPGLVVHHGADHVLDWPGSAATGPAVTFAHHSNKNPDLVLDAWADGRARGLTMPDLLILGTGSLRDRLRARLDALGLTDVVRLAPYLPEDEFHQVMREASMIVFPSEFEGFGLPVVEGMALGIPVVIGPEPAVLEVAGGHAVVMERWSPRALADAVARAGTVGTDQRDAARRHAAAFTWVRSVEQTRDALVLAGAHRHG